MQRLTHNAPAWNVPVRLIRRTRLNVTANCGAATPARTYILTERPALTMIATANKVFT